MDCHDHGNCELCDRLDRERDALIGFAIDVINGDPTIEDAKIYKALPERLRKQIEGGGR